jgi:hypothetical protein
MNKKQTNNQANKQTNNEVMIILIIVNFDTIIMKNYNFETFFYVEM